jgi:acetate kinase
MGFSTLVGLAMGTRCGNLDPGIFLDLLTEKGMTVERVQGLLYEESGLRGVSGLSSNMHDLLVRLDDPAVVEAVEVFCYQARRHLAALTASLGGLDRLVFTSGIGAHAPGIRTKICAGLEYLGIRLAPTRNANNDHIISPGVAIEALPTDEELMIARHVRQVLEAQRAAVREA